jgi:hypothetical protein
LLFDRLKAIRSDLYQNLNVDRRTIFGDAFRASKSLPVPKISLLVLNSTDLVHFVMPKVHPKLEIWRGGDDRTHTCRQNMSQIDLIARLSMASTLT